MNESDNWPPLEPERSKPAAKPAPETPLWVIVDQEPALHDPEPQNLKPARKQRSCWFKGLVFILVLSMLASGLLSVMWLIERSSNRTAVAADATPIATHSPATTTTPVPDLVAPASPGRIVYINPRGQIVTVDPDGANGRVLTESGPRYQFPAWSPNGQQVAAIGRDGILLLRDEETAEPVQLYTDARRNPFYLYWSPDGRFLSFLTNDPQNGIGLRLVNADATEDARLLATGSPFYWNWTGDSQQVLIHTGQTGDEARLALLNTNSEAAVEEIAAPGLFQAPGISADGRYWAYAENRGDGTSWLVVTDRETGERWVERHLGMVALGWSPSGAQLAFTNGARERATTFWGPLRLFDAATGATRLLSANTVLGFFWSPDGRYLATINTGDNTDDIGVNVVDAGHGRRFPLAKTRAQEAPQINLAIINLATGEEKQLFSFTPSLLFIGQFLPFFDQYALSHRIWSPNSDAIVLPVREERGSRVLVIPIDGSPTTDLGSGEMPFWSSGLSNP